MKIRWTLAVVFILVFASSAFAQDFASEKAKGDKYWPNRDNQSSLVQAIAAYETALSLKPSDEDLLVRLSLAYYWKGNNMSTSDKDGRKASYTKGMEYAQKACDANQKSVGGNFWYATNKASYGREQGIVKSASYLTELKARMKIVMDQDKFYFWGGPQRFFARIIYKAPGFLRKSVGGTLEQAESMLKEAIAHEKNFFMSHLFLAQVYLEMGKKDLAKQELQFILDTSTQINPAFAAANRRDKKVAVALMKKEFGE